MSEIFVVNDYSGHEFGLPPQAVLPLKTVLARHSEIVCAKIYGSRAKGNFKPNSDIDMTLLGGAIPFDVLLKISGEFDDLLLPYKIDLSILEHIQNAALVDHINRVGKVFYESAKVTTAAT